jgi:hypothetical protein
MLMRLETAFVAQREFVSNASHELRTPLAIMRAEVDVTLADPETDADGLRHMAETIRVAITRSEDVIDKLLVLAESGDLVERGAVDLANVVRGAAERHARAADARGLLFQVDAQPSVVVGDDALLERLADNLVDNAVRYASPDSVIHLEVRSVRGDRVTLRVANAGDVIAPEEVPRLFERFYRRGTSRSRHTGGSGLGLAIVPQWPRSTAVRRPLRRLRTAAWSSTSVFPRGNGRGSFDGPGGLTSCCAGASWALLHRGEPEPRSSAGRELVVEPHGEGAAGRPGDRRARSDRHDGRVRRGCQARGRG